MAHCKKFYLIKLYKRIIHFRKSASPQPSPGGEGETTLLIQFYKRIVHLLNPNSCYRSVPGINLRVIRQSEELGLDTVDQGIKIAAGQVGSADTHIKQCIAADDKTAGLMIKSNTAGRMTG